MSRPGDDGSVRRTDWLNAGSATARHGRTTCASAMAMCKAGRSSAGLSKMVHLRTSLSHWDLRHCVPQLTNHTCSRFCTCDTTSDTQLRQVKHSLFSCSSRSLFHSLRCRPQNYDRPADLKTGTWVMTRAVGVFPKKIEAVSRAIMVARIRESQP